MTEAPKVHTACFKMSYEEAAGGGAGFIIPGLDPTDGNHGREQNP
jgi:hypothetical protein